MAKHDKTTLGLSTILNPVPVVMISCAGKDSTAAEGRPNIITVAWTGTINSEPPMVSVSIRKSRHSHKLISETGEFVINLVNKQLCKPCDLCGVKSGADIDKFEVCGLNMLMRSKKLRYRYRAKSSLLQSSVHTTCLLLR